MCAMAGSRSLNGQRNADTVARLAKCRNIDFLGFLIKINS